MEKYRPRSKCWLMLILYARTEINPSLFPSTSEPQYLQGIAYAFRICSYQFRWNYPTAFEFGDFSGRKKAFLFIILLYLTWDLSY